MFDRFTCTCLQDGNPVHSKISSMMRQTVVYCCVQQLWKSFALFSDNQLPLPPNEGSGDGDLELQLLAAMLALSARSFLKQEQSTIKKKRLKLSTVEPSRGLDCSSCGPLSPRSSTPRASSPTKSEPLSEVSIGYISISPSPSELALPNRTYSSRENLLSNEIDYSPIISKLPFSTLVVLREALLPFYVVSGLEVDPQLRTLCHNSAEYFLDMTLEAREVTAFVCKSTDVKATSSQSRIPHHLRGSSVITSPSLIGEQLALNGCVRYCTSPQLGRGQRSKQMTLLKPTTLSETNENHTLHENIDNKTNISCKCCVSLDNLASTVTTPLLKLTRHMTETARFRSKVRKHVRMRADDMAATPKPSVGDDLYTTVPTVFVSENVNGGSPVGERGLNDAERFAQSIVEQFVAMEQDTLPTVKESGNATPSSTGEASINMRVFEYSRSPRVSKSLTTAVEQDTAKLSIPVGYPLSDSSGGPRRGAKQRKLSTASNSSITSEDAQNEVAITIEGTDMPIDLAQNNTSPEEVLSTQDTCGDDTTDNIISSDGDGECTRSEGRRGNKPFIKVPASAKDVPSIGHTHLSPTRIFSLAEGELLYSVFGLLRINRIGCDVQIETTKLSLELNAVSAAADARKSLPPSKPQQRSQSVAELDQLMHFDLLPTYLSVSTTLRKSLVRVNDRGLPDNDILLFSALPVYGSVGVFNHSHQKLPMYRCLLKFAGLELDIKQSPVKVHHRYQQLLPTFTNIYNNVFASNMEESGPSNSSVVTSSETSANLSKITNLKLPSQLPGGVIHFKIDKLNLIMAPLPSLTITYYVSIVY